MVSIQLQTTSFNALTTPCLSPSNFSYKCIPAMNFWGIRRKRAVCVASSAQNLSKNAETKRKVVEHICLLKAKRGLSDEEEKDMLDFLYTSQYHMAGIVAISLGRASEQNPENYTHGVSMRFQRKEDLAKFYENPLYLRVLKEHVTPHCHDLLYVDFESEVEDDVLAIFRKGELMESKSKGTTSKFRKFKNFIKIQEVTEFNYGVDFVLLMKIYESALDGPAEEALASLANLIIEFPSLIVQSTQGCNFNPSNEEYSHGVMIRFRSVEAQKIFLDSSEYKNLWGAKLQPISQKTLSFQFLVDPVGTQLM